MEILSVRQRPELAGRAVAFFQGYWGNEANGMVYRDCIESCLASPAPLPQWYLLMDEDRIAGGAGLVTNDFISRMDLWPWLCALYVEPEYRRRGWGGRLVGHMKTDAARLGYGNLYLSTDLVGYYEQYGFVEIATGYHPWGEASRIYRAGTE